MAQKSIQICSSPITAPLPLHVHASVCVWKKGKNAGKKFHSTIGNIFATHIDCSNHDFDIFVMVITIFFTEFYNIFLNKNYTRACVFGDKCVSRVRTYQTLSNVCNLPNYLHFIFFFISFLIL